MSKENILVVEDDMDIQQLVSYHLIRSGYNVSCADSGEQGLQLLAEENISAVILDLMLPGKNGMEVCADIREDPKNQHVPVIMLTALGEESDIVAGLDGGADDYVTKPFSPKVLMARVEAVLRRDIDKRTTDSEAEEVIAIHDLRITPCRHEVLVAGKTVQLTTTEFTILLLLARRPGWVFSRQQIIDQIRGYDYSVTPRAVDVQIFGLRKKLDKTGKNIETVRGIGYRLKE